MVNVAMLPPFGPIVGVEHVNHSCSVDRKAEAQDKFLTERGLDPLSILISFCIFYCCIVLFCSMVEEEGRQHCC